MNQQNPPWRPPQQQQQWQPQPQQQQQWQQPQNQQQQQQWQPQQQRPPQGPPTGPPGMGRPPGAMPKSKQSKLPSAKKKKLLRILLGLLIFTAICTVIAATYFYINYV